MYVWLGPALLNPDKNPHEEPLTALNLMAGAVLLLEKMSVTTVGVERETWIAPAPPVFCASKSIWPPFAQRVVAPVKQTVSLPSEYPRTFTLKSPPPV